MTIKYKPCIKKLHKPALKYWHIIGNNVAYNNIFKEKQMLAYKRYKNLGDLLRMSFNNILDNS